MPGEPDTKQDSRGLLLPLLASAFVLSGFRRPTGFIVLEPWEVVAALCFVSWTLEILSARRLVLELDRIGLFALAVVAAGWLSYFGALDVVTWFKRASRITCLFGVYLFLVMHVPDERRLTVFLERCLITAAVAAVVMLVQVGQWIRGGAELARLLGEGFPGTFANYNEGSTYLAMLAVLLLALWVGGSEPKASGRLGAVAWGLCVSAVITDQSRSGLLALIVGTTMAMVGARQIRLWVATACCAGVAFWVLSGESHLVSRWLAMFGASGDPGLDAFVRGGTIIRVFLVRLYWMVIKSHPIFGIGAANYGFMARLPLHWPAAPAGASPGFETIDRYLGFSAHNGFLSWWAETGTVGLLPLLGSLVGATSVLVQARKQCDVSLETSALALGGLAAIGAFVVSNLTGDFCVSETRYWMLLAVTSIVLRISHVPHPRIKLFSCEWGRQQPVAGR